MLIQDQVQHRLFHVLPSAARDLECSEGAYPLLGTVCASAERMDSRFRGNDGLILVK